MGSIFYQFVVKNAYYRRCGLLTVHDSVKWAGSGWIFVCRQATFFNTQHTAADSSSSNVLPHEHLVVQVACQQSQTNPHISFPSAARLVAIPCRLSYYLSRPIAKTSWTSNSHRLVYRYLYSVASIKFSYCSIYDADPIRQFTQLDWASKILIREMHDLWTYR